MLARVRMFQNKPDGEVTIRFAQDANGMPAPVMQDPLHYPHGTAFLAPGPLGQCHPIPDDPSLKAAMARAAANHQRIYDSYNLPYDPEPGSDMDKAMKVWRRKQARKQRSLDKKLQREAQKIRRMEQEASGGAVDGKGAAGEDAAGPAVEDIDEDDLIAFATDDGQQGSSGVGPSPPSVVASVSMGLSRAAMALQKALHHAAITAPPRRSLTRPMRRQ